MTMTVTVFVAHRVLLFELGILERVKRRNFVNFVHMFVASEQSAWSVYSIEDV